MVIRSFPNIYTNGRNAVMYYSVVKILKYAWDLGKEE